MLKNLNTVRLVGTTNIKLCGPALRSKFKAATIKPNNPAPQKFHWSFILCAEDGMRAPGTSCSTDSEEKINVHFSWVGELGKGHMYTQVYPFVIIRSQK